MNRQHRWCSALLLLALAWAAAQPAGEVEALLRQGRALTAEARQQYAGTVLHPDQPLWRQALRTGEEALELAPDSPAVLRFLAETYNEIRWDIRAWNHWLRYLEAGGELDASAAAGLAEAGTELGFARYRAADMQGALGYYRRVHDLLPDNQEALTWLGRIHFELGQPHEALPYWQRLVQLKPDDAGARYYLGRVQRQLELGVGVEQAFEQGLAAYRAGDLQQALSHFERAAGQGFVEALAWAGRVSLELGRSKEAKGYWERLLSLNPGDERAAYFLELAEAQLTWGAQAALAYYRGRDLYAAGEPGQAALSFAAAVAANGSYKEAAEWAARSYQELGEAQQAINYWQRVVALDPEDARARNLLELAQDQLAYGREAASAFSQGLSSYQQVRFDEAENFFRQATEANPGYAEAWAWLGRIAFDQAQYAAAAAHYQQALELEPDNEAYGFFAQEARRLAGTEPRTPVETGR